MYDYGSKYYNERNLKIRCVWIGKAKREDVREISMWLSEKNKIVLPQEPDKYYVGELYDSNELIMHYNSNSYTTTDGEFELNFICEPFAYKKIPPVPINSGINHLEYNGTVETPTLIVLKNNNNFTVNNLQIIITKRK